MDAYAKSKAEQKARHAAKLRSPLRKIVCVWKQPANRFDWQGVTLECGHSIAASSGAQFKARCMECAVRPNEQIDDSPP